MVEFLPGEPTVLIGPPRVGVFAKGSIDEWREVVAILEVLDVACLGAGIEMWPETAVVSEAAGSGPEVGLGLVDPALDAAHMPPRDLVAHGIGQCLHGVGGFDGMAVEVEQ